MNTNTKKFLLGGVVVVLLGGYALWSASRSSAPAPLGSTSVPSETTNPNANPTPTPTPAPVTTGKYKDGTYTGSVGDAAPYGTVQVKITVSGGKLASITMLQQPEGPGETNEISARTFPKLIKEAITIQSSKVNIVSGATQDTQGFQQSLSSALTQAQS